MHHELFEAVRRHQGGKAPREAAPPPLLRGAGLFLFFLVLPDAPDFDNPQLTTDLGFRQASDQCFEEDAEVCWGGLGGQPEHRQPRIEGGLEQERVCKFKAERNKTSAFSTTDVDQAGIRRRSKFLPGNRGDIMSCPS